MVSTAPVGTLFRFVAFIFIVDARFLFAIAGKFPLYKTPNKIPRS